MNRELIKVTLVVLVFIGSSQAQAGTTQGLAIIPGVYGCRSGCGHEVSLIHFENQSGGFGGWGVTAGRKGHARDESYVELQAGGSGWGIASMTLGYGRFWMPDRQGWQSTFAFQFWTPFFWYWRAREGEARLSDQTVPLPTGLEYGLMFKLPLPFAEKDDPSRDPDARWKWGASWL